MVQNFRWRLYIYIWKCPNVLNIKEIKENLPCECDSILFVVYLIPSDDKPLNYTMYIDFTFMDGNKPYEKMFNLYSYDSHDRSKTLLLKIANSFISSMQQKDLISIKLSKLRTFPTSNSCQI